MSRVGRNSERSGEHRCARCRMQRALCVCALLPTLATRTRLVLLLHQLEVHKTTNTGRLALLCLPTSRLVLRGRDDRDGARPAEAQPAAPDWLTEARRPVLLFPAPEAGPLIELAAGDEPVTLIVPDGTWSQAARMRKRYPGLGDVPCARLPDGLISTYRLRHDPRPGFLSTLQAIAHALGLLEGPAIAEALLRVHQIAVERTLYSKGRLAASEVTGGIPR